MAGGKRAAAIDAGPIKGPWDLPDGWRWRGLGEALPLAYGKALSQAVRKPGGVRVYGSNGPVGSHSEPLTPGPVVIVGRKGGAGLVHFSLDPCWPIDTAYYVQPAEDVDVRFAFYLLSHLRLSELDQSTAIPSLSRDTYSELIAPFPDKNEQVRIARHLDALFDQIQDGEEAMVAADEASSTYREAVLKAAACGDLTEDWRQCHPDCGTGAELLIDLTDKAVGSKTRNVRTDRPAANEDDLPELPSSWTWAKVGQLGSVVTGATPATSRADFYGGDVAFFTPTDLNDGFGLSASRRTITEAGLASIRPIAANSVMVTCIGATIGKTGHTLVAGATNQQINSVVPWTPELAPYLFAYFSGPVGRSRVIEASSSTTMPILNKGDFSHLPVPLPPRAELVEINARLEVALNRQDELSEAINELASSPATLRQSILSAAFRGTLAKHVQ